MPTFRPPLGTETEVLLQPILGNRYLLLTFIASLEHVDPKQELQLWTNLPKLDIHGMHEVPAGEWHPVSFSILSDYTRQNPHTVREEKGVTIPCVQPAPQMSPFTHMATVAILSQQGQFEYTLRIEGEEGQYHWLGSGSSNGRINIRASPAGDVGKVGQSWSFSDIDRSESWAEATAKLSGGRCSSDVIQLGKTDHSLTVITRFIQPEEIPFSRLSEAINLQARTPTPIAVRFNQSSSKPTTGITPKTLYFDDGTILIRDAIYNALKKDRTIPFKLVDAADHEVAILTAKTPFFDTEQTSIKFHLFARTPAHKQFQIDIPTALDNSAPILLDVAGSLKLLQVNEDQIHRRQSFNILPGFSSAQINFTEFLGLRGNGSNDVVFISCPLADQVEVGEMDIGDYIKRRNSDEYRAALFAANAELDWSEAESEDQSSQAALALDEETGLNRSVSGIESSDGEHTELSGEEDANGVEDALIAKKDTRPWLLKLFGLFFGKIWSLLALPFRKAVKKEKGVSADLDHEYAGDNENIDDRVDGAEGESDTADESTPLLKTPGLSRSASSTVDSPLASPESVLTVRPAADMTTPYQQNGSKAPTLPRTPDSDNDVHPPVHLSDPTNVRSYTLYTFYKNPPFSFYIPESVEKWEEKIKFMVKADLNLMFREVKPVVGKVEGGVKELILGEELSVDDTGWEVEVERI